MAEHWNIQGHCNFGWAADDIGESAIGIVS